MKRINHTTVSSTHKAGGRIVYKRIRRTDDQRWYPRVHTYDNENINENTRIRR